MLEEELKIFKVRLRFYLKHRRAPKGPHASHKWEVILFSILENNG
jgi:hypothetical protein